MISILFCTILAGVVIVGYGFLLGTYAKEKPLPLERVEDATTFGLKNYYHKLWPAVFRGFPPGIRRTHWNMVFHFAREGDIIPLCTGHGRVFFYRVTGIGPEAPPWADTICSHQTYGLDFHHIETEGPGVTLARGK